MSGGLRNIPNIKRDYSGNFESHDSRVENMIRDALRESKDSPKLAIARMPIIADMYKNLDNKSRERLAPVYESLVYRIRDIKS